MTPSVGATLGPWTIESVSAEHMKTLAVILDDPNPIHLDAEAVKALGMGERVINQGPANLGYVMNLLSEALPGARIASVRVRFLANVLGGDRVSAGAEVLASHEQDGERRLDCAIWLDVDGRGHALEGTASLVLGQDVDAAGGSTAIVS